MYTLLNFAWNHWLRQKCLESLLSFFILLGYLVTFPVYILAQVLAMVASESVAYLPIFSSSLEQQRLISDLNPDTIDWLAFKLDPDNISGNWKQLASLFDLRDYIDKMKDGGDAHRLFFYTLFRKKPELTLNQIKEKLERKLRFARCDIFRNIENITEKPDFDKEINDFSDEELEFVLEEIADKLVTHSTVGDWRHLAGAFEYRQSEIDFIKERGKNHCHSPTSMLLDKVSSKNENVSDLISHLKRMERNDIAQELSRRVVAGSCWQQKESL